MEPTDPLDYIASPVLRPQAPEEGQDVLILDERSRLKKKSRDLGFFKTILVEVNRVNDETQVIYKVHLVKNCQAIDLLDAFEEFLELSSTKLYIYDAEVEVDAWLGDAKSGSSYILMEQGSKRKRSKISQHEGCAKTETAEELSLDGGVEFCLTPDLEEMMDEGFQEDNAQLSPTQMMDECFRDAEEQGAGIPAHTLPRKRAFPSWPQPELAATASTSGLPPTEEDIPAAKKKQILHPDEQLRTISPVTPKKNLEANRDDGIPVFQTPSPIVIPIRKQGARRPNWTLMEKKKLLTMVILKMDNPTNKNNKIGKKDIGENVFPKISPSHDDRPMDDLVQQYYRSGHPTDQSINGGGMYKFLKEQMKEFGLDFNAANIRARLKDLVDTYEKLFLKSKLKTTTDA